MQGVHPFFRYHGRHSECGYRIRPVETERSFQCQSREENYRQISTKPGLLSIV